MGLSFADLHKRFPRLIVCDISGYGEGGPYEQKKAYDLLIQSEGGFLSVTGGAGESGMAKAGCSIADIAAGMYAYTGVLSALLLRDKTGEGSVLVRGVNVGKRGARREERTGRGCQPRVRNHGMERKVL